jgi:hypothetical protein
MSRQPADYHTPAYPDIYTSVAELKNGNMAHVEPIISFLERDPYTYGSGYWKEKIWRYLLRVDLTEKQKERLRQVAVHYVKTRISREFFTMSRFISGIVNERFAAQVRELEDSHDHKIRLRAAILSAYLRSIRQGEDARRSTFWRWVSTK